LAPAVADRKNIETVPVASLTDNELLLLDHQLQYRAPPLDGIWVTAPYLHNGSVPNMYQLLLPDYERDEVLQHSNVENIPVFFVGSTEYDSINMGFKWNEPLENYDSSSLLDTRLPGNSNSGHSGKPYGTDLTDVERYQLIEYLKIHKSSIESDDTSPTQH